MKTVSILTSVYNKERWLDRYFKSVLSQTYENIEIVVVDHASTDNSLKIINKFAQCDSRIKVVPLDVNRGPSGGFGAALRNAAGYYCTYVDADDYIDSNYIEELVKAIEDENADLAICVNDIVYDKRNSRHKRWPPKDKYVIDGEMVKKLPLQLLDEKNDKYLGFHMPEIGAVWIKLYKTSILKDNNIMYEDDIWKWCDFIFNLEVLKVVKKVVYVKTTCYHFYQSDASVTRIKAFQPELIDRIIVVLNKVYKGCSNIMTPELKIASNRFYYRLISGTMLTYYSYYPDFITEREFCSLLKKMLITPAGEQLLSTRVLPNKTFQEKLYLFGMIHSKPIQMIRLYKILSLPMTFFNIIKRIL